MIRKTSATKASRESNFSADVPTLEPRRAFIRDPYSRKRADAVDPVRANNFMQALGLVKSMEGAFEDPNGVEKAQAGALRGEDRPETGMLDYFTKTSKASKAWDLVDADQNNKALDGRIQQFIGDHPEATPEELRASISGLITEHKQYSSGISDAHFISSAKHADNLENHYASQVVKMKQDQIHTMSRSKVYDNSVLNFKTTLEKNLSYEANGKSVAISLDQLTSDPTSRKQFDTFIRSSEGLKYKQDLRNMFSENSQRAKDMGVSRKDYTKMMVDYISNESVSKGMPELLEVLEKSDKDGISMIDSLGPEGKQAFQRNMSKARSQKVALDKQTEIMQEQEDLETLQKYSANSWLEHSKNLEEIRKLGVDEVESSDPAYMRKLRGTQLALFDKETDELRNTSDRLWLDNPEAWAQEVQARERRRANFFQSPDPEVSSNFLNKYLYGSEKLTQEEFENNLGLLDDKAKNAGLAILAKQKSDTYRFESIVNKDYDVVWFSDIKDIETQLASFINPISKGINEEDKYLYGKISQYRDLGKNASYLELSELSEHLLDTEQRLPTWKEKKEIFDRHRKEATDAIEKWRQDDADTKEFKKQQENKLREEQEKAEKPEEGYGAKRGGFPGLNESFYGNSDDEVARLLGAVSKVTTGSGRRKNTKNVIDHEILESIGSETFNDVRSALTLSKDKSNKSWQRAFKDLGGTYAKNRRGKNSYAKFDDISRDGLEGEEAVQALSLQYELIEFFGDSRFEKLPMLFPKEAGN